MKPKKPALPYKKEPNAPLATPREFNYTGMSLRDYFAGQALGLISNPNGLGLIPEQERFQNAATICYSIADAMLIEREKSRD